MRYKIEYRGINSYTVDKKINLYKLLPWFFISVFLISFFLWGKEYKFNLFIGETLERDEIKLYIDKSDEVSKGKAQVNWQEVAALCKAISNENDSSLIKSVAEKFLITDNTGTYKVISLNEVMNGLNLKSDGKTQAKKNLEEIKSLSLYGDLSKDKQEFIEFLRKPALENFKHYGIFPSITMAQAILESGWGDSTLATDHNNLFGIKADNRWSGSIATISTKENYDDVIEANFRKYNSKLESIQDQGAFLYSNERYTKNGVFSARDYMSQAQALEDAGYSTAKNESGEKIYADKLITVIQNYNLMLFDTEAIRSSKN